MITFTNLLYKPLLMAMITFMAVNMVQAATINVGPGETYTTIQAAIDNASPGDVIEVASGIYTEQLHITTNNLTIQGVGDVTVKSPANLAAFFTFSSDNYYPVVFADGADGTTLKNLTVDGDKQGNNNSRFEGIAYWNAGGTMEDLEVINVMNDPLSGAQHGVAVYSANDTGDPYDFIIDNVDVQDFQKNGFSLRSGETGSITMSNCDVIGAGPTDVIAQNGIQVFSENISLTLTDCSVEKINYTGTTFSAVGVLIFFADADINNVTVSESQVSFYTYGSDVNITESNISSPVTHGFVAWAQSPVPVKSGTNEILPQVSFFEENMDDSKRGLLGSDDIVVTISDCNFSGSGNHHGVRIVAPDNTTVSADLSGNVINNWKYGIYSYRNADETGILYVDAFNNNLAGNSFGFVTNANQTQTAFCNWWGSTADADIENMVQGDVDYRPWLISDDLSNPECAGGLIYVDGSTTPYDGTAQEAIDAAGFEVMFKYSPGMLHIDKELEIIYDFTPLLQIIQGDDFNGVE